MIAPLQVKAKHHPEQIFVRMSCPAGQYKRDGNSCTGEQHAVPALQHCCWGGSPLATLPEQMQARSSDVNGAAASEAVAQQQYSKQAEM